ncbi:radical SAM protein [Candidatus Bathyarchaeota archaeon]|nr:radical SAM protein [Candidatus Bathyarchaeota archaeon]
MSQLLPETVWQMNEEQLQKLLDSGMPISNQKQIRFYAPSFMYYKTPYYCSSTKDFPTISITGKGCALRCKHCGGKVLETMYPATTSEKLLDLCTKFKREGALGCLISGGCLPNGYVPLENFVDAIGKVKRKLGLTIFVHTGVIDSDTAKRLRGAGVDAALIDIIGSDETIKEIYNLNVTVRDYDGSLRALHEAGIVFVPHVIVGLHYGRLQGEFQALKMISKYAPSALVVIAFMPIHGTEMAEVEPPKPIAIAKVLTTAKLMFPHTPLVLGCMRPKGKHRIETDTYAIKAGVNAIAFPAEEAIKFAQNKGLSMSFSSFCCSQIYADINSSSFDS